MQKVGTQKDRRDVKEDVKLKKKYSRNNKCKNCERLKKHGFNTYCESLDNSYRGQNEFVSTKTGKKMADELKISKFMEISALRDRQVSVMINNYNFRIYREQSRLKTTKIDKKRFILITVMSV